MGSSNELDSTVGNYIEMSEGIRYNKKSGNLEFSEQFTDEIRKKDL